MMDVNEGTKIVKAARHIIESYLTSHSKDIPADLEQYSEHQGVFVTLHSFADHNLRGCIGIPEPVMPLKEAILQAAISAATSDPRFPTVTVDEMDKLIVEVSILTQPELIEINHPKEYLEKIKIGRDGLIIRKPPYSGLLLPQVPVEWKWNVEEFLEHTCMKAGLTSDIWLDPSTKLYSFQAQVFSEKEPKGDVKEKPLQTC